jgi:hypothetical protein
MWYWCIGSGFGSLVAVAVAAAAPSTCPPAVRCVRYLLPRPPPPFFFGKQNKFHVSKSGLLLWHWTSCAIKGQRSQGTRYWPPFAPWVQGGAGVGWVCSGGSNLPLGPLGSVAGDPDRHRSWLLCPSSVLAAAGRGLRPRVFSAHGPPPQLQVQDSVMGRRPIVGIAYTQTGGEPLLHGCTTR